MISNWFLEPDIKSSSVTIISIQWSPIRKQLKGNRATVANKSAAAVWCHYVNMDQNLRNLDESAPKTEGRSECKMVCNPRADWLWVDLRWASWSQTLPIQFFFILFVDDLYLCHPGKTNSIKICLIILPMINVWTFFRQMCTRKANK